MEKKELDVYQEMNIRIKNLKTYKNLERYPLIILCLLGVLLYFMERNPVYMIVPIFIGICIFVPMYIKLDKLKKTFYLPLFNHLCENSGYEISLPDKKEFDEIQKMGSFVLKSDKIESAYVFLNSKKEKVYYVETSRYTGNGNFPIFKGFIYSFSNENGVSPKMISLVKYGKKYPEDTMLDGFSGATQILVRNHEICLFYPLQEETFIRSYSYTDLEDSKLQEEINQILLNYETKKELVNRFLVEYKEEEKK